ncbi:carboxypeptidase-like regulatory domain-containing protein [Riemerella anatipestifer]|uniref:carboxypeptidase-like regulatory domain-containing protein n=1 Tax=Riemerella anatipestifer TaxID=34085 RepID=UPI001AD646B2|nr:carboxypeptidase-like regulatory domain-containing protein [Riemerella anatipestifer]MBO4234647.1 carboxypeptidase-like regulatory domain-containing protein [Riemerella anatipestifer]
MRVILLLVLLRITLINAQSIKGYIKDFRETPLSGAVIYIDGTQYKTQSNQDGKFYLLDVKAKTGNLIVEKKRFSSKIIPIEGLYSQALEIKLEKETEIPEVKLLAYTDKAYKRYIEKFLNTLLGYDRAMVYVKNPKDIQLAYDREEHILKARAKAPLIISNEKLGYVVNYNLLEFELNLSDNSLKYLGTSFFSPMKGSSHKQLKWQTERLNAYYGSSLHFFRALYQDRLSEEGFSVDWIIRKRNEKYPSLEELKVYRTYIDDFRKKISKDSVIVFNKYPPHIEDIARRKEEEPMFYSAIIERNILSDKFRKNSENRVFLEFKDLLGVNYKKYFYTVHKKQIQKTEMPVSKNNILDCRGLSFEVYSDGNYSNPSELVFEEGWARSNLSELLPLDFEP